MTHAIIITIMALAALGVWTAFGDEMLFEKQRKWIEGKRRNTKRRFPMWIQKMAATCNRCMVTIYGTVAVLCLGLMPEQVAALSHLAHAQFAYWVPDLLALAKVPVYIVCAVGLQEMLHR